MTRSSRDDCERSYDRVVDEYVRNIFDELRGKPLDRELLDRFAASVRDVGPACDMGCGPGHVACYLEERGVEICGVDLSRAMVERARELTPEISFHQDDMTSLDAGDGAWAGIIAFYSIIHLPPEALGKALAEFFRTLRSGGLLLLAFHVGDGTLHLDEWWGQEVSVDFHFFRPAEISSQLLDAGFEIEDVIERDPYPDVEHASRRCYIFARHPAPDAVGWRRDRA